MSTYRIKNWAKFQHFKDRKPPWIKLYRDLLDDPDWHELEAASAKVLVMLWLIASEDGGVLPPLKKLAFRLRLADDKLAQHLSRLDQWLIHDDIAAISERHQVDAPETETEEESEKEPPYSPPRGADHDDIDAEFVIWYQAFPRHVAIAAARKAYVTARKLVDAATLLKRCEAYAVECRGKEPQFIAHPATWLRAERWKDEAPAASVAPANTVPTDGLSQWRARVEPWSKSTKAPDDRFWMADQWGPAPHKPGTKVPREILDEFEVDLEIPTFLRRQEPANDNSEDDLLRRMLGDGPMAQRTLGGKS